MGILSLLYVSPVTVVRSSESESSSAPPRGSSSDRTSMGSFWTSLESGCESEVCMDQSNGRRRRQARR